MDGQEKERRINNTDAEKFLKGEFKTPEEVMIRYKDVNGYPNRLYKVANSEEEAREWFEREHPQCEIIDVRWRNKHD